MPRNITVTFSDGSSHIYQNAPDNVTPEMVTQRAQQQFGKTVTNLDGGGSAPAQTRQQRWAGVPQSQARAIVAQAEQNFANKLPANLNDAQRMQALQQFHADPRMRDLRAAAGLPPVLTRGEEVQNFARARVAAEQNRPSIVPRGLRDFNTAVQSGASRMLFGIPERVGAAVNYYTGTGQGKSYQDQLDIERAITDEQRNQSTAGNVLGTLVGAGVGGSGAGALVRGAGRGLVRAGATRLGNVLEGAATARQGQTIRNTYKTVQAGAAGGAAQAAGEGSDVGEGAASGAAGAAILGGAAGLTRGLAKTVRNVLRPTSSNTGKALREVITESPDAIQARQANLSQQTGSDVPMIAALNDRDFGNVTSKILKPSDAAQGQAKDASGQYIRGFMDRLLGHVNNAGKEGNALVTNIGDLADVRRNTATEMMAPIREKTVDISQIPLDDVEREVTREIGSRDKGLAPRIKDALTDLKPDEMDGLSGEDIANARKVMNDWGLGKPVHATVGEMDALRRSLSAAANNSRTSNPANAMAYDNAAKTVSKFLSDQFPQYGKMVDTYAKNSRIMEGFKTAANSQRVGDIEDSLLRGNLKTPEGQIGMRAGELYKLREAATARPTSAINLSRDLAAEGKLTRPASIEPGAAQPGTVTENIGERPAANLVRAAQGENQVLGRMLDTDRLNLAAKNEQGSLSPEDLASTALLGHAFPSTQARHVVGILRSLLPGGINDTVAANIASMLYSSNPAMQRQALNVLNSAGIGERFLRALETAKIGGIGGQIAASGNEQSQPEQMGVDSNPETQPENIVSENPDQNSAPEGQPVQPGGYVVDSPYADRLQNLYNTESPEMLDLIERVGGQESSNRQVDKDGQPITSKKGALGIMQVMPKTAPEAAQLAGVPFDENAYKNDPVYNKLIGSHYLMQMLRQFNGDVAKAVAAYNAGPDRVNKAVDKNPNNWLALMPAETQDYVQKVS